MVSPWLNTKSCLMVPMGFGVEVIEPGRFSSVLRGFHTELDAHMWIATQRADEQEATAAT